MSVKNLMQLCVSVYKTTRTKEIIRLKRGLLLAKSQLKNKFRKNARLCPDRCWLLLKVQYKLYDQYVCLVFINEREPNDIFSILNLFFLSTET